jgi:recombination protein RecR
MGGPELEHLIALFSKLPGLGPRSARRIVLKLLRERETRLLPLADAIRAAANTVKSCSVCGNLDSRDPCMICAAPSREETICVVETVADLWAFERALIYRGRYHVLGGLLSALSGRRIWRLRICWGAYRSGRQRKLSWRCLQRLMARRLGTI